MLMIGFSVVLWAWCLLGLGLPRHHQAVLGRAPGATTRRAMRTGGWLMLAAGLAWFVGWKGWAQGPIFWSAALVLAALAWVLAMTLVPRRSLALPVLATVAALAGFAAGA